MLTLAGLRLLQWRRWQRAAAPAAGPEELDRAEAETGEGAELPASQKLEPGSSAKLAQPADVEDPPHPQPGANGSSFAGEAAAASGPVGDTGLDGSSRQAGAAAGAVAAAGAGGESWEETSARLRRRWGRADTIIRRRTVGWEVVFTILRTLSPNMVGVGLVVCRLACLI